MGTDDPLDTLYMFGRFLLSGLCFAAAVPAVAYAIKVRARLGRDVRLAHIGAALLIMAATVSAVDAVENVFILTREPTALSSWMRLICIDMLLPFYAYLLVCAWQERDQAEAELSRLLVTDPLTGTLNRRGFFERAIAAAGTASRAGQAVSVIMLDLDRFKDINDGFGHAPATRCCDALPPWWRRRCSPATCSAASAARNSQWCCPAAPRRWRRAPPSACVSGCGPWWRIPPHMPR